ncbi:MAG: phenylalanine--tRNA ligase subunit beta, partial [Candidatus Kapaibacterium sp.]
MHVSYNWLKQFVDIQVNPRELEHVLTILGHEVEEIIDYSEKFNNFFTGKVVSCEKHPDADKLSVCQVDYGRGERQIICGASNVAAGQKVMVAAPGAYIPAGDFEIGKRKIRGVESEGMICSQAELGLGEDSGGIEVLPEDTEIGVPIADYLGLNDAVYDISITPNRADCLSHLGLARDLAAYFEKDLKIPDININENGEKAADSVAVEIDDPAKCPRYTARVIRGIRVQESPEWLKSRIVQLGLRPVNAVVDVTNFVMYECGQPLHAFDIKEINGNKIIVRTAREGEKFTTLDGIRRQLDSEMLMICDAERSVAIGGVMGGENSEIKEDTTEVILESAVFAPGNIRRSSR